MRSRAAQLAVTSAAALSLCGAATLAASAPAGASAKTTTVTAVETDFHIALSKKSFSPGAYIFIVKNKGQTTHALTITGPGVKNASTPNFLPGKSEKLKVTLKRGRYDFFCPVPGHKALGMNLNVTVGAGTSANTSGTTAMG
jgi:plastocyanin